jgi:protein-histidine N-methyltransferase
MTESDAETSEKQEYVDASSDLIPGLYEGGLKTWEGGVDLIKVLSDMVGNEDKVGAWAVGGRILEVRGKENSDC